MSSKSADAVLAEARERIQQAYDADRDNRKEAATDLAMLAGIGHWTDEAKAARKNRPMLTINRLPQFVRQVTNSIRQSDLSIKVQPVDDSNDTLMSRIYNDILKQIQHRSSAEHIYASAVEQQASCGIGWFRILTEYSPDGFDQELRLKRILNPLSVYCDPGAIEPDRSDAMWMAVAEMVPRSTFKQRYPKAKEESFDAARDDGGPTLFWSTTDTVLVAEYWRRVPITRRIAQLADGKVIDITNKGEAEAGMLPIVQTREVQDYAVEQHILSGAEVLAPVSRWAGRHIPLIPVIGAEVPVQDKLYRYGVIRFAREPQQLYNFYRSAVAEAIALAPKAPYLATTKQIGEHKAMWDTANQGARPYLLYEPDNGAPGVAPKREHPPEMPAALFQEANVAAEDMKATTGIYDAGLGARSNETSGRAILARESQGDTANFHFIDNFKRSLEHAGRVLIDLIPKIYDNERVLRITGENTGDAEQSVPINVVMMGIDGREVVYNDLSAARFDIRVSVGPNFASKRQEAAEAMMEFIGKFPDAAPLVSDLMVANMDWPGSDELAKRLRTMVPPQALQDPNKPPPPPPDPLADPVVRADVTLKNAQARKAHADASKSELETTAMAAGAMLPAQPLPPPEMMMGQPPQMQEPPMGDPGAMGPPEGAPPVDEMPADMPPEMMLPEGEM